MRIQNKEVIMLEITKGQFNMMSIFLVITITIRTMVLPCAGLLLLDTSFAKSHKYSQLDRELLF